MSSYLGHPSFTLRRVTGTLPARARQLPNAKFSPKLFSDDVLIISSDDHWYLVSPLDIEPTRPCALGTTVHEFSYLQADNASNDGCVCCNPDFYYWDLPTGQHFTAPFNVVDARVLEAHLVPGKWINGACTSSRFRLCSNYRRPPKPFSVAITSAASISASAALPATPTPSIATSTTALMANQSAVQAQVGTGASVETSAPPATLAQGSDAGVPPVLAPSTVSSQPTSVFPGVSGTLQDLAQLGDAQPRAQHRPRESCVSQDGHRAS